VRDPLVTLVSPVYNSMPYLQDFLDCLAAQTWRPLEVILVDDGSADDSVRCLQANKDRLEQAGISLHILLRPHGGQAAAFNAALPLISGEFFTWCDADDLLSPDSVEKKVRWLMAHPHVGMVRSNGTVLDADKGIVLSERARESDRQDKNIFDDLFQDLTYCYAGCYMIRTALFFTGYPDKKMPESPEGQNLQLLLPAASRTVCGYLDEKLHTYCRRRSGHSSRDRSYQENLLRLKNFTALRLEILKYCDCDRERYTAMAQAQEQKNMRILLQSAVLRARKELGK